MARVLTRAAAREGASLSTPAALRLFRGRRMSECLAEIEARAGRPLAAGFERLLRQQMDQAFAAELRPVAGIHAALARIRLPLCVASNGPLEKLERNLARTGLAAGFQGRLFSAYEVGAWKPDPSLFLHAAATLNAEPSRCVVVEDSLVGVAAGLSAGMRVFGYAGGDPETAEKLIRAGATVFMAMSDLPPLLETSAAPCLLAGSNAAE